MKIKSFALFSILVSVFLVSCSAKATDNEALRQELEKQIQEKEAEINQHQQNIGQSREKSATLKNEIGILESQIKKIRAEISQIDLVIRRSNLNISEIDKKIVSLEEEIEQKKELLAEYIRTVAQNDTESLLEVLLKNDRFSDFFNTLYALEGAQKEIQSVVSVISGLKEELLTEREGVEDELAEQNQLKALQLFEKKTVEGTQQKKENLLSETKGQEQIYQKLIQGAQKDIAHIKEQLSLLDKYDITLNDAVSYAIFAGSKTGIRPAFLLGVLEAESRLGLNVGKGNWQEDMYQCYRELGYLTKANKEKAAFLGICEELGLDPNTQPVSAEPWYGCGGAMGIAQFMPTTWLAYKERISALSGNNPPSPWNLKDGFLAAAIKLADAGATEKTELGERTAYAKYLGGTKYQKWIYHSVTNYVIDLADNFQEQYFQ